MRPHLQQPSYPLNKPFSFNQHQKTSSANCYLPQSHRESDQDKTQLYLNQQFLETTFGNNLDYIQIFLTLPHLEKLKLYQLMQEEGQQGKIIDKESYINILAIMIEKIQKKRYIYQNSNRQQTIKICNEKNNTGRKDGIETIHFQQRKISTILKDIKKWEEENNIQEQLQQTISPEFMLANKNTKMTDIIKDNAQFDSSNDVQDNVNTPSTNSMSQKQNLNIFDSFQETTIRMSIESNKEQQKINRETMQKKQTEKHKGQSNKQQQLNYHLPQGQNTDEKMKEMEQNDNCDKLKLVPNLFMRQSVINIQIDSDFSDQEQDYQWKEAIVMPSPKTAETIGKNKKSIFHEQRQKIVINQPQPPKQNRANINLMKKPIQSNFLSEMNIETSVLYMSNTSNGSPDRSDEIQFQDNKLPHNIADPPKLLPLFNKVHIEQNNLKRYEQDLKNENKYLFLDHLKIQLSPQNNAYLKRQLKNNSFECNSQFYMILINYLKNLSLQELPEFQHFSKQLDTVKQISNLTERYSKAVEEDQQEKVQSALLQSKQLYKQIFNNSHRTEQFLQKIMKNQFKQKGFLYKFGMILVDSNVDKDLIEGTLMQGNLEDIENSFYFLYVLEKIHSLSKLSFRTEKIIVYYNYEYQKIKNFDQEKLRQIQRDIEKHPKFIEFINDLLKICSICERIIYLSKACCIRIQGNILKTLRICKQLKNKYLDFAQKQDDQLFFQRIKDNLKKAVIRNKSLLEIQADFSDQIHKNPLCCICLKELNKWGGKVIGQNWFHNCCLYFINQFQNCP